MDDKREQKRVGQNIPEPWMSSVLWLAQALSCS